MAKIGLQKTLKDLKAKPKGMKDKKKIGSITEQLKGKK